MKPIDIFRCTMCGDCCKGFGGTYLTEADIIAIADYIHEDPARFVSGYTQMSGGRPVLAQGKEGYCVFWDKLCTIHPVKPRMCRQWPFIQSVLADTGNWHIMAGFCPGIRTDIPDDIIRSCVSEVLAADRPITDRDRA